MFRYIAIPVNLSQSLLEYKLLTNTNTKMSLYDIRFQSTTNIKINGVGKKTTAHALKNIKAGDIISLVFKDTGGSTQLKIYVNDAYTGTMYTTALYNYFYNDVYFDFEFILSTAFVKP